MTLRKSAGALAIVVALAGFANAADAQEFRSALPAELCLDDPPPQESRSLEVALSVQGRASFLHGAVDPFIGVTFRQLFTSGLGVIVESDLLLPVGPSGQVGFYLSLGWDRYEGMSFTDAFGDTLTPEHMDLLAIFAGVRFIFDLGLHFRWESHVGLGAGHNAAVNGVIVTGGAPTSLTMFSASTQFAVDLGTRLIYDLGPIFFDVGIGFRSQQAPDNGGFPFLSSDMSSLAIEFGVGIRF